MSSIKPFQRALTPDSTFQALFSPLPQITDIKQESEKVELYPDLDLENAALVLVNPQMGFLNKHTRSRADYMVEVAKSGIFDHVVATAFRNFGNNSQINSILGADFMSSEEDVKIIPYILPHVDRVVVSGAHGAAWGVHEVLASKGIETAVLMGFSTEVNVVQTAGKLVDTFVTTYVDSKGCASISGKEPHKSGIKCLKNTLGKAFVL